MIDFPPKTANSTTIPGGGGGMRRAATVTWSLLMSLSLPACLLASEIDVSVPECVPAIEDSDTTPTPLDSVTRIVLSTRGMDEQQQVFEVDVHDCRTQRRLEYQVAVNYDPNTTDRRIPSRGTISPTERQRFSFDIPLDEFAPGECNKVTLFVSGEFDFESIDFEPVLPGDQAQATWFLEVVMNSSDVADLTRCRQR